MTDLSPEQLQHLVIDALEDLKAVDIHGRPWCAALWVEDEESYPSFGIDVVRQRRMTTLQSACILFSLR